MSLTRGENTNGDHLGGSERDHPGESGRYQVGERDSEIEGDHGHPAAGRMRLGHLGASQALGEHLSWEDGCW